MPQQRLYDYPRNALHPLPTKNLHGTCHATAAYSLVARSFRPDSNRSRLPDVVADRARQYIRHAVAFGSPLLLTLPHSLYAGAGNAMYTWVDMRPLS